MKFTKKKLALAIGGALITYFYDEDSNLVRIVDVSFSQRLQYRQRQESRHY